MLKRLNVTLIVILAFWLSLVAAWQTLSAVDFFYPTLYGLMDIDRTIAVFGPQNRYKKHFENTTDQERYSLFSQITEAINNHGRGLEQITYHDKNREIIDTLLREPEIVHLQDVALLIDRLRNTAYVTLVLFGLALYLAKAKKIRFPPLLQAYSIIIALCLVVTAIVMIVGPTKVFYKLHTLIFPDNHQWFFYYQDSLMTTLMKAPDLFGYIALLLLLGAFFYFSIILLLTRKLLKSF